MNKPGLEITKDMLLNYHEFPAEEIGMSMFCPSFSLNISDIRIICLLPRLPFDDERLFIIFIDVNKNIFVIPDIVLKSNAINEIERLFNLKPILDEWGEFEYSEHNSLNSKIIYPPEMKGKKLFKMPFENIQAFIATLKNLFLTNNTTKGLFTEEVKNKLK